ncbi:MAG: dephospho-CoA kinase [Candidatus Pelagibacterales bacterium]|nr:MAG: dephospho-CoA kinase [Pelagibacterales bacterium]
MIKIGIIGDIGSGKSYIAKQFGYPVFNADNEVQNLYKKNKKCFKKLNKILPNYIISYPIKKEEILKAILSNNRNLKKIGKVIHPEVSLRMNKFIKNNKKKKFIILDVPLLIENKINKKKDILVFIDAKKKEINKRLKKRIGYNKKIIRILKKLQLPVEFKRKKSQFIIKNNFKTNSIKKNVKMILKKINI